MFTVTTAGAGYSPPSSIVRRLACVPGDRFAAISMGLARLYASTSAGRGHTAPSIRPLHQPDQVLGHPAVLRLRDGVAESAPDHPWPYRNIAERGRRPRVRRTVQCPVAWRRNLSPAQARQAWRDAQARRMRQTCVQGTGCDTQVHLFNVDQSAPPTAKIMIANP